jgi:hypothetical protein
LKDRIEAFLADLDQTLQGRANGEYLNVFHIGRSSLIWRYDYAATTTDIDILEPRGGTQGRLLRLALELFGEGTHKAQEHGLYLQPVHEDFPPTPNGYKERAEAVPGPWRVLRVYWLEPHDFAVTKLKRFEPRDRQDLRLLCDAGLLGAECLKERLVSAFPWDLEKDGDAARDAAFRNLDLVTRYLAGEITDF